MNDEEWRRLRRLAGWGLVGLIILIGISIVTSLIFFAPRSPGGGFYPFFFPFGWFGLIFLVFIIFWVARWIFWPWRGYSYRHQHRDAASILKERYAKGEITKEQFEQMTHDLNR